MYQYRNLPPRHQAPGFYPPHQPSLRSKYQHQLNAQQHSGQPQPQQPQLQQQGKQSPTATHSQSSSSLIHSPPSYSHNSRNINSLTRSASHGAITSPVYHSPPHTHPRSGSQAAGSANGNYRTHHIVNSPQSEYAASVHSRDGNVNGINSSNIPNGPDALYAMQQLQRIKAATACQIINNRVVEAIREQQKKKWAQKQLKKKLYPGWTDPNETNPNNPAYKGPENAKLVKMLSKKKKAIKKQQKLIKATKSKPSTKPIATKIPKKATVSIPLQPQQSPTNIDNDSSPEIELDPEKELELEQQVAFAELEELERKAMTIPQLEISTAPRSTANITNLTEEDLKMNPELYQMYSYYAPFANTVATPIVPNTETAAGSTVNTASNTSRHKHSSNNANSTNSRSPHKSNAHLFRTNMGPRRMNPNFLKPQINKSSDTVEGMEDGKSHSDDATNSDHYNNVVTNNNSNHQHSNQQHQSLPPQVMDNPFDINNINLSSLQNITTNYNQHKQQTMNMPSPLDAYSYPPASIQSHDPYSQHSIASAVAVQPGSALFDNPNTINNINNHTLTTTQKPTAKLVPIGKERPNPLEAATTSPISNKHQTKSNRHKTSGKQKNGNIPMAPAHTNVQSVISPNGGIYHPCHGYSTREISIFDLFPGIVKYQSKKYSESDRVDYLLTLSEKPFAGVNNRPLNIDEAEMWYTALKYLFNDITLGQFEYMTLEMRYVIKQYMNSHRNRTSFLNSIKQYGFLRVISDVSKKLPREHIQKIMKQEQAKKEKEKLLLMAANEKLKEAQQRKLLLQQQLIFQQQQQQHLYPAHYPYPAQSAVHPMHAHHPHHLHQAPPPQHALNMTPPTMMMYQGHIAPQQRHYNDWYKGNKLKRTISEPTPVYMKQPKQTSKDRKDNDHEMPAIIDDDDDGWEYLTKIVAKNKFPELPPENKPICKKRLTPQKADMEMFSLPDLPPSGHIKRQLFADKGNAEDDKSEGNGTENEQQNEESMDREMMEMDVVKTGGEENAGCGEKEGDGMKTNGFELEQEHEHDEKMQNDEDMEDVKAREMDEIIDVYTMMYQTMKAKNRQIMEDEAMANDDDGSKSMTEKIQSITINDEPQSSPVNMPKIEDMADDGDEDMDSHLDVIECADDDDDDIEDEDVIITEAHNAEDTAVERDAEDIIDAIIQHNGDKDNEIDIEFDNADNDEKEKESMDIQMNVDHENDAGPNIDFAELSGLSNKPKSDDSFIPKLPFNVNWNNNNSLSIWVDNPYAKPSKYFKTNKKHKRKRSKSSSSRK